MPVKNYLVGLFACVLVCIGDGIATAADQYYEVKYPASDKPNELKRPVSYMLWVPQGVTRLRGVIVHLHGNGPEAGKAGAMAAYDLHWQALARKWDCALLAPCSPTTKENWSQFFVPGAGSHQNFHRALKDLAVKSNHPELNEVPWCLWGHSAGAVWAGLMQSHDPDRIVAIWLRSGSGWGFAEQGYIPNWRQEVTNKVRQVPVMYNYGVKEKENEKESRNMLRTFRAKDAPMGVAAEPNCGHNCGNSRYLAIPFFDACLAMRLPDKRSTDQKLKPVDMKRAWLADPQGDKAVPAAEYRGDPKQAIWLPNERIATAWMEYVKKATVTTDTTPPPAAFNVKVVAKGKANEITWEAKADVESGLRAFLIQRDSKQIHRIAPQGGDGGAMPCFQGTSFHDTPVQPRAEMRYVDQDAPRGAHHTYEVIAVNGARLQSTPTKAKR